MHRYCLQITIIQNGNTSFLARATTHCIYPNLLRKFFPRICVWNSPACMSQSDTKKKKKQLTVRRSAIAIMRWQWHWGGVRIRQIRHCQSQRHHHCHHKMAAEHVSVYIVGWWWHIPFVTKLIQKKGECLTAAERHHRLACVTRWTGEVDSWCRPLSLPFNIKCNERYRRPVVVYQWKRTV